MHAKNHMHLGKLRSERIAEYCPDELAGKTLAIVGRSHGEPCRAADAPSDAFCDGAPLLS
jgi:hypothetical protein